MIYRNIYISYPFLLLAAVTCSVIYGSIHIPLVDIFNLILGNWNAVDSHIKTILLDLRLPRIIMALLVGMMLASSGVVTQTVFKNPLADPYIIGIAASATFGAVLAYVLRMPQSFYGIFAFITCTAVSLMIFKIASKTPYMNVSKLLMIGIAISSFLGAFTSFAIYLIGEDSFKILVWTMGYIGNASWSQISLLILPLVLSVAFFYKKRHELDVLLSGDEEAHALGVNVGRLKKQILIISSLLVGFSVAFTGMIGFIGLIIPHCIRMLIGASNTKVIPLATLFGGLFLLICDTIARLILAPIEIPIGVITAFFGAPFFLFLAMKARG